MDLKASEIRCTSVPEFALQYGADPDADLRREVVSASVVIGVMTKNSMDSAWVLFELGARWGCDGYFVPIVGGAISFDDLPKPIRKVGLRAAKVSLAIPLAFARDCNAWHLGAWLGTKCPWLSSDAAIDRKTLEGGRPSRSAAI